LRVAEIRHSPRKQTVGLKERGRARFVGGGDELQSVLRVGRRKGRGKSHSIMPAKALV